MRTSVLVLLGLLLATGCSYKVKVHALQPAKVDRVAKTKTIAVHPFSSDKIGLSSKIEAELSSKRVDGKNYFTIISRNDIERIFREQKLQYSGLLDESTSVQAGNLLGAQALISGVVSNANTFDSRYTQKRQKCVDKKCTEQREYSVTCLKRTSSVSAQVKIVDIEKGDIIYSDTLNGEKSWERCSDQSHTLPSSSQGLDFLSSSLASDFAQELSPYYSTFDVTLLDSPDLEYNDPQEKSLENALVYIERKRYEKAEELLSRLLDETEERSYVAAYNLGVIKEVKGELEEAMQLYALADSLTLEPVEEIDNAILRIKGSITSRKTAREQMNR